jgi:DNA-binding MarR family transcriptional regulator
LTRPKSSSRRKTAASGDAAKPVDFGPLAGWVGFNLRMAQASAFQAFSRLSQDVGENPGRFATLMLIAKNPGISQTTLSRANGRDKSSLTPVLEDLVRRGLIQRQRMHNDRRTYRLKLTPAGEKTLAKLIVCAQRHEENLDRAIGARHRTRFLATLRQIAAELD